MSSKPITENTKVAANRRRRVDPEKRKRTVAACLSCKKRKKKCDGRHPCSQCIKRSVPCLYEPAEPVSSDTSRKYKLTFVNGDISKSKPDFPVNPGLSRPPPQAMTPHSPEFRLEDKKESSRLLVNPEGRLHYIGESSTLSLLEQARQLFSKVLGPTRFSQDPKRFNIVDGSPNKVALHPVQLPSRKIADNLLSLYEQNIASYLYVVNMPDVYRSLDDVYDNPIKAAKSALCILHLMFALGSVYDQILTTDAINPNIFFESALGFLDESVVDVGEVWVVEAYLLSSLYDELQCKRNSSWVELGKAIRYAQALGLHRPSADRRLSLRSRLHRRALWKSLYIQDGLKSVNLGRPPMLTPYACDPEDEIALNDDTQLIMTRFCDLIAIINDISADVYGVKSVSSSTAQSLISRLKTWSASLGSAAAAENMGGDTALSTHHGGLLGRKWPLNCSDLLQLVLSSTYLNAIILLTRPFLFYEVAWKTEGKTADAALVTFEHLSRACIQSAITLVSLTTTHFYGGKTRLTKPSLLISYLFTCGVVLHLEKLKAKCCQLAINPNLNWAITSCTQILGFYSKCDLSATRFHSILSNMDSALGGYPSNVMSSPPTEMVSPSSDTFFNIHNLNIDNAHANDSWSFTSLGPIMSDFLDASTQNYNDYFLSNFSPVDATLMNSEF